MTAHQQVVDVLGVGFGPANMALAIALDEYNAAAPEHCRLAFEFLERRETPSWHPDMLFDDASMQISFLKDLATMRNPQSPYTFVSFLKSVGRLVDFTNRGSMVPLRVEFAAYLRWVAQQLSGHVRPSTEVTALRPVLDGDEVSHFEVDVVTDGLGSTVLARHVVVAAGLVPRLPAGVRQGVRVWHSHHHLSRVGAVGHLDGDVGTDLVVVGSGQSAVEIVLDSYRRFPEARVHLVSSRYGIAPSDQGPLVNQIFDPAAVDDFYDATPDVRARMDAMHRNANNGVAHPDAIEELFDTVYRDRWLGRERLHVHRMSRLASVSERPEDDAVVRVELAHDLDGSTTVIEAGALVLATGYTTFDVSELLGQHRDEVVRDVDDRPVVERDSRARLRHDGRAALYLVGQSEHLHGFSTSLLSTVAVRAGEIADSILGDRLSRHPGHRDGHLQDQVGDRRAWVPPGTPSTRHEEPSHV